MQYSRTYELLCITGILGQGWDGIVVIDTICLITLSFIWITKTIFVICQANLYSLGMYNEHVNELSLIDAMWMAVVEVLDNFFYTQTLANITRNILLRAHTCQFPRPMDTK